MKLILLTIMAALYAVCIYGQSEIKGKVLDIQTKEAIPFASIYTLDKKQATTTDLNGNFILKYTEEIDTIEVFIIGYKIRKVAVGDAKSLVIQMETDILNMQEVIISANREQQDRSEAPTAIHKISPKLIEETRPTLLPEVLNKVPGVIMVNLNNEQHGMSIRQPMSYNSYFLYLEDGIPVRPVGVFNHNALIEINTFSVSSIEVIKGPSSSLYGSEAIGGAVNFITHRPTALPTARLGFQMDNYGYFRTQFSGGTYLSKNLGIYFGGYMAKQRNGWQTFSDYDKLSLNFRADYSLGPKTKLTTTYATNDYDSQMGGSVDSTRFYSRTYISLTSFAYRKVNASRARLTLSHNWNSGAESFLTLFYRKNSIGQFPSYAIRRVTGNPTLAHGEINENGFISYGAIVQNSIKFNFLNSKILAGISVDYSPNDYWAHYVKIDRDPITGIYTGYTARPDSFLTNYDAKLLNSAAYFQYEFSPIKNLRVVAGTRYDRIDFTFDNHLSPSSFSGSPDERNGFKNFSPKVGATYDIGKGRGIYANYSRGFSPPTINQLYRGVRVPDLKPAIFDNYELGGWAYFINRKIYLDWAIYQMIGFNEIINFTLPDNSRENRNAGKTLHRGVEYSFTWSPSKQFFLRMGGTNALHKFIRYSTKEGLSFDGKEMPNSPKWIFNCEITYKPSFLPGFRYALEYQRISSYFKDNENKFLYKDKTLFNLSGISVLNFRTGYSFGGIEVFMNILNLTNELYAHNVSRGNFGDTFTPSSPRLYTFGIMYNFTGKE